MCIALYTPTRFRSHSKSLLLEVVSYFQRHESCMIILRHYLITSSKITCIRCFTLFCSDLTSFCDRFLCLFIFVRPTTFISQSCCRYYSQLLSEFCVHFSKNRNERDKRLFALVCSGRKFSNFVCDLNCRFLFSKKIQSKCLRWRINHQTEVRARFADGVFAAVESVRFLLTGGFFFAGAFFIGGFFFVGGFFVGGFFAGGFFFAGGLT